MQLLQQLHIRSSIFIGFLQLNQNRLVLHLCSLCKSTPELTVTAVPAPSNKENYGYGDTPVDISYIISDPGRCLTMLNKYPLVKATFIQYNTTLPSSAVVERLLSVSGQTETARRNKLSDKAATVESQYDDEYKTVKF